MDKKETLENARKEMEAAIDAAWAAGAVAVDENDPEFIRLYDLAYDASSRFQDAKAALEAGSREQWLTTLHMILDVCPICTILMLSGLIRQNRLKNPLGGSYRSK